MATEAPAEEKAEIGEINKYNFRTETTGVFKAKKGLNREVVHQISDIKNEPDWMREFRLRSLDIFESKPMPKWGGAIDVDFQDIYYYLKPTDHQTDSVVRQVPVAFVAARAPAHTKVSARRLVRAGDPSCRGKRGLRVQPARARFARVSRRTLTCARLGGACRAGCARRPGACGNSSRSRRSKPNSSMINRSKRE